MVGDAPVDNEAPMLRESQDLPAQFFRGVYRDRVCVPVFIGMSVHALWASTLYHIISQKKTLKNDSKNV